MRLVKFLAHAGVASRRAAEGIVGEGRVTVDGEVVTDPARDVDDTHRVELDGRRVEPEPHEVHALNKPAGVVSTARDTHGRPTVVELVRSRRRLYPVGRLDADTTGLILLTNDGALAERLTHPRYGVKKVYRARVKPGRLSPRALEALKNGVELDDGRTAPAQVRRPAPGVVEITIREGRKRQVRRMLEAVGQRVVELERVAFGPLGLRGLEPGRSRRLTKAEVERLRRATEPRRRSKRGPGCTQAAKRGASPGLATIPRRMKLRALRGAITVEANEPDAILSATEELVREVMERNGLDAEQMVSCIFTCTNDLDAEFPAVAARNLGLSSVPLLCAREIDVPGALPMVIRLLLHCYSDPESEPRHVYLREAESLRRDLKGAQ